MNNPEYKRKGQMETFGLAFIVIILILGIFLILTFRNSAINNPRKNFIADELSVNFVNTVINVNVKECYYNKYTVSDLLKYCGRGEDVSCGGVDACKLAKDTIINILNSSLVQMDYSLRIYTEGLDTHSSELTYSHRGCKYRDEGSMIGTAYIPLRPYPGEVTLNMQICDK